MNWTVAVITDGKSPQRMFEIAKSVCTQPGDIFKRQLLVVGGEDPHCNAPNSKWISFDEKQKDGWITRKKNIACREAMFENILLIHDYFRLDDNWFAKFEKFDEDWDVCVPRIIDMDGNRYRDWVLFLGQELPLVNGNWHQKSIQWLDYNVTDQTHRQYVSGGAYCIKKAFALQHPLDESKVWSESEDLLFSFSVRNHWRLKCNPYSVLHIMKEKQCWPPQDINWGYKQNGGIDGLV